MTRADIELALGPCQEAERVGSPSGMGECWRIVQNGAVKACKVITRAYEPERFEREVEAMQRIDSPRVVRVFGRGKLTTADDGKEHPYFLSEFLEGGDVREHIDAGNQPEDGQLRAFTLAVLEGVEELHRASVVHRDLKPDNIILLNGDWTKPVIIDLGLARLIDLSTVTVYPWIGGTWTYMAPEQLRAERAFDRTDIWAVAVIVAELASGQHPFWRAEPHPPADWHGRLQAGMTIPGSRPAGLRDWLLLAGEYRGYRRPTAVVARQQLESMWP
ncbi:Serine/threonine-protein kinase PknL [Mycobacterium simulans]|uniref:Serine/threonine-protein kinase PknL n=1 Tax=Mycobacterium simulans TaxID=627089 RepID=A0A7Z7ILN5_9MYCO|nr:serine/threonine-protein kinase [Mycobacterium simulans]SOJ54610.1 Serine/threonine-protein kinase PknL [Mycobacterium simulans]